jgi:hypothetical protein
MADRLLHISWADPARGMEERAVEVFNEALGILGRKQQEGKIERFDVVLLAPNGELGGYMHIVGSHEQIDALQEDEDFHRNVIEAQVCVDDLRHLEGYTNEGVARQMELYMEAVAKVHQRA